MFSILFPICICNHFCNNGTKAESCSGETVVKDDSASQMTAAKIMDVVARLPGSDGHAADAVSAYTQVKLKDVPRFLSIPKIECPDAWRRPPRHFCQNRGQKNEDPVIFVE